MKRVFTSIAVIFIASLGFCPVNGQTTIDAEFRPRTEFREGYRKPLSDTLNPAFVTSQRTRFNADYKSKILNARISLEDSRIWGNTDLKSNITKTAIYEAWFEYLITSGLSLQMGRQPLKYDDNRLFSSPAWSNSGVAHDVLVLKYKSPLIAIHSGFAYNNSKDTLMNVAYTYNPKQNYKALGYFWISKQIYKGTTLSAIGICDGFESKIDYQTVYSSAGSASERAEPVSSPPPPSPAPPPHDAGRRPAATRKSPGRRSRIFCTLRFYQRGVPKMTSA
jgi:hypothetical protein